MNLYRSLAGEIRATLTGADIPGTLAAASRAGILLRDVTAEAEFSVCVTLSRGDYRRLSALADRRGDLLRPAGRRGLYWDLGRLSRRRVLLAGLAALLALSAYVPGRVVILEVEGNSRIPASRILEAASECGISFGVSRREVRSEKVKNALLEAMPELSWAGVNTYGCRAVITVRERDPEPEQENTGTVSSIVAARDGHILSCDVSRGSGLCAPGQAVTEGQVLISGYTDCGLCITAGRAEGEVMAATSRHLTALTPLDAAAKGRETGVSVKYSLIVGKKRINFDNNSGISGASCDRMVANYHLTLPGGYRLPVTLVKETVTVSELDEVRTGGESVLKGFAAEYLGTQMIAGTITGAVETVTEGDGVWVLEGEYACTEMIGRERAEQNGELHETD